MKRYGHALQNKTPYLYNQYQNYNTNPTISPNPTINPNYNPNSYSNIK